MEEEFRHEPEVYMRPHCENETCTNDRNYYCFKHLKVLCNSCFASLHSNCKHEEITHKKDVEEIMNSVRDLLSFTKRNSIEFNAHDYIPEATQEIKDHINSFLEIERRFLKTAEYDVFEAYKDIKKDVLILQTRITESMSFSDFSKFMVQRSIASERIEEDSMVRIQKVKRDQYNINLEDDDSDFINPRSTDENKYGRMLLLQIKEENEKLIKEQQRDIEQMSKEIEEHKNTIQELTEIKNNLEEQIRENIEEHKREKENLIISYKEKEQKEKEDKEHEIAEKKRLEIEKNRDSSVLFSTIYNRNIGNTVPDPLSFDFKVDTSNGSHKNLIRDIADSKCNLPDLKRLFIDRLTDENQDLNRFLEYCEFSKRELLCLNWNNV